MAFTFSLRSYVDEHYGGLELFTDFLGGLDEDVVVLALHSHSNNGFIGLHSAILDATRNR